MAPDSKMISLVSGSFEIYAVKPTAELPYNFIYNFFNIIHCLLFLKCKCLLEQFYEHIAKVEI